MATTNYKVEADFTLRGVTRADKQVAALTDRLGALGAKIRGADGGASSLVGRVVGLGAAYAGLRAATGVFSSLARGAVSFRAEVDGARIGLASVVAAVDGISFEKAQGQADMVFRQLQGDAIKSVATTKDLFAVYQQITGPIRAAGFGMEKVREITNSTVAAATALGVDLPQATRDIGMMTSGVAGQDVKLFRMLRATGAIQESTEEWNKNLTQAQRIEKLTEALGRFAPAAEAYSKTWGGLTSSLRDIAELSIGALGGPTLAKLQKYMEKWIDRFVKNRDQAMAKIAEVGKRVAGAFDRVFAAADRALEYVVANFDKIVLRIEGVASAFRELVPKLIAAAKAYAAVSVARTVVGGGMQVAGAAPGLLSEVAKMAAATQAGVAAKAAMAANQAQFGSIGLGGGAFGAISGIQAALPHVAALLGTIAAVLVPLAGILVIVNDHWRQLVSLFDSFMSGPGAGIGQTFAELFSNLYEYIKPLLKFAGFFVGLGLVTVVGTLIGGLTLLASAANKVLEWLKPITEWFTHLADVLVREVLGAVQSILNIFNGTELRTGERRAATRGLGGPGAAARAFNMEADAGSKQFDFMEANGGRPVAKMQVNQDFRGSKISVKQDFRDADPDNVAYQMMADIGKQASARAQSGFVPALSR